MKWEEQSKEMVGTFIHKFTSPAIEQLLHTGKEKIYRYNILIVIDFWLRQEWQSLTVCPSLHR